MVLIHSRRADDTTIEIIQWLSKYGLPTFRVNVPEDLEQMEALLAEGKINAIYFNGNGMVYRRLPLEEEALSDQVQTHLEKDIAALWVAAYHRHMSHLPQFGTLPFPGNILNKLRVLDMAKAQGFDTPEYKIVYTREKLQLLHKQWGRIICKPIEDGINAVTEHTILNGQYTEEIRPEDIEQMPIRFFPTLVQPLIEKSFEVRTFYFNGLMHSIALFTQSGKRSAIDGRIADPARPQRKVPFALPQSLSIITDKLMKVLGLNYGSVDFIVTPEDKFYFLEVNPYGQYGFLSKAGNYYIEKQIAAYLCRWNN